MNSSNWDRLRFFLAAAETGSLTAAAKTLGSNQPTVGRHIDALEGELGTRLFQRSVKGLTLTEEGVELLDRCRTIHAQVIQIGRTLTDKKVVSGSVRVALPEGLCLEAIAPVLPRLYKECPGLRLILNVSPNTANLTRGEADIAVRLYRPKESSLVVRTLGKMDMGLYAGRNYIDRFGAPSAITTLSQHRIISYGDQLAQLPANQWLLKHSRPENQALSSDSTSTRLKATLAGVGISIQPHLFARTNPDLVPVLDDVKLSGHDVWLVYHSDLRQLPRIIAVAEFLTSTLMPILLTPESNP